MKVYFSPWKSARHEPQDAGHETNASQNSCLVCNFLLVGREVNQVCYVKFVTGRVCINCWDINGTWNSTPYILIDLWRSRCTCLWFSVHLASQKWSTSMFVWLLKLHNVTCNTHCGLFLLVSCRSLLDLQWMASIIPSAVPFTLFLNIQMYV